ncbi:hypothetical protein CEXT_489741 [Caerostris extrusa]|uniref:DUF4773 domain-containing protein n=1 Tax=Caerostris extrusa TaxID=172846 RepID=A0AAV4M9K1_CAEEX|nr:hypothetical protein CEXT_489741 [Caerostris extrusa]
MGIAWRHRFLCCEYSLEGQKWDWLKCYLCHKFDFPLDDDEQLLDDYEQLVPKKHEHKFNCKCDNITGCGCCGQLYIIRLKTHEEACVQFKYRAESTSLTMTFLVGGRMIFSTIKSKSGSGPDGIITWCRWYAWTGWYSVPSWNLGQERHLHILICLEKQVKFRRNGN